MQSMESHTEGLGTNSHPRASRNKEPALKLKPQSLGGHRRLKFGQVCMDWGQRRGQSMNLELLELGSGTRRWKFHPGESHTPSGAAGKSTRQIWEPELGGKEGENLWG